MELTVLLNCKRSSSNRPLSSAISGEKGEMLHLRPGSAYLERAASGVLLFAVTPGNDAGFRAAEDFSGQTRSQLSVYCTSCHGSSPQQREAPEQAAGIAEHPDASKCRAADEDIAMLVTQCGKLFTYQSMAACSGNPSAIGRKTRKSGRTNAAAKRNRRHDIRQACA